YRREKRIYELSQAAVSPEGKTTMPALMPFQVPFRHLCNLIQIADGDIDRTIANLQAGAVDSGRGNGAAGALAPGPEQIPALRARAVCAKYWVENCAPEEFRFRLKSGLSGGDAAAGDAAGGGARLSEAERKALRLLRDDVVARIETFGDDKSCAEAIYAAAEKAGLEGKALFRAAYLALIGKEQGPRLANFLRSIEKKRLLAILGAY
ncbi:MAG: hypothetical protein LBS57_00695, partial [Treponema sp.]|nr:hypothetical protein [Treponema sp.]